MDNSTPILMTEAEFNEAVKRWAASVKNNAVTNIDQKVKHDYKDWKKRTETKLRRSLELRFRKDGDITQRIRFNFARHGVFLHYGVGRGYVRQGNSVVKGRRSTEYEIHKYVEKGEKPKDARNIKVAFKNESGKIERKPIDWLDVEIKTGIKVLANVAQEFYGDKAMRLILDQWDKATIEKRR